MLRKTIRNQIMLDIRCYSAEALKKIKCIQNVITLILPKDASNEYLSAYAGIKKNRVVNVVNLDVNEQISTVNGGMILTGEVVPEDRVLVLNGSLIVHSFPKDFKFRFIINGSAVVQKGIEIDALSVNGSILTADFNSETAKIYGNMITVDSQYIENIQKGTNIVAGNMIEIDSQVSEDEIIEKDVYFIAGNSIKCDKKIVGCVKARSTVGNSIG